MYQISITKAVKKFLDKHPDLRPRFLSAIKKLAVNPFEISLDIKKMEGD